jgi:hypothetical protein
MNPYGLWIRQQVCYPLNHSASRVGLVVGIGDLQVELQNVAKLQLHIIQFI